MNNPVFTDSHTHLYLDAFDNDWKEVINRGIGNGITRFYLPNIDSSTESAMMRLCKAFPLNCFPMMGIHPTSIKENYKEELCIAEERLSLNSYAAIGEIGIDLYWDKTFVKEQTDAFRLQLEWGKKLDLPVVIHVRDSFDEIFEVMDDVWEEGLAGVFHSFTGNLKQAEKALSYGFYLGINGIVTFKNSGLDKVVANVGLEKILIETDAPFLAPVPFRGKRNESLYIIKIAEKIAEIHAKELHEIAEITSVNALNLFKLS